MTSDFIGFLRSTDKQNELDKQRQVLEDDRHPRPNLVGAQVETYPPGLEGVYNIYAEVALVAETTQEGSLLERQVRDAMYVTDLHA